MSHINKGFWNSIGIILSVLLGLALNGCEKSCCLNQPNSDDLAGEIVEGPVIIRTQDDVFAMANVTNIAAYLQIGPSDDIVDLSPLQRLKTIGGDLVLTNNQYLRSLKGLDNLVVVGGSLRISSNRKVKGLYGLEATDVHGQISITGNDSLKTLSGLKPELSATGLQVTYCRTLLNLDGCPDLPFATRLAIDGHTEISLVGLGAMPSLITATFSNAKDMEVFGQFGTHAQLTELGLWGCRNPEDLFTLPAFPSLEMLWLEHMEGMETIGFLDNLPSLKMLSVSNNPDLLHVGNMSDLPALETLDVKYNDNLLDLVGLPDVSGLTRLEIHHNSNLQSLDGVGALPELVSLVLVGLDSLEDLSGLTDLSNLENFGLSDVGIASPQNLPNLPKVRQLSIQGCRNLASLSGLPALPAVENFLLTTCNQLGSLETMPDMPALQALRIRSMPALTTTAGVCPLSESCTVTLYSLPSLTSLEGLSAVEAIDGLAIESCSALTNLNGLESLQRVVTFIRLDSNTVLTDISALENVNDTATANLSFSGNTSLDQCVLWDLVSLWPCAGLSVVNNAPCQ